MSMSRRGCVKAAVVVALIALSHPADAANLTVVTTDPAGDARCQDSPVCGKLSENPNHPIIDVLNVEMGTSGDDFVVATTVLDVDAVEAGPSGYVHDIDFAVGDWRYHAAHVWLHVLRDASGAIEYGYGGPRGSVTGPNGGGGTFPVRAEIDVRTDRVVMRASFDTIAALVADACNHEYGCAGLFAHGQQLTGIRAVDSVQTADHVPLVPFPVASGAKTTDEARTDGATYTL